MSVAGGNGTCLQSNDGSEQRPTNPSSVPDLESAVPPGYILEDSPDLGLFSDFPFDPDFGLTINSGIPENFSATATQDIEGQEQNSEVRGLPQPSFVCGEGGCTKTFQRQSALKKHKKTHVREAERPHGCPTCAKRFLYHKDVTRHLQSKHRNPDEPLQRYLCYFSGCPLARKGFSRKDKLQRHIRTKHIKKENLIQDTKNPGLFDFDESVSSLNIDWFDVQMDNPATASAVSLSKSMASIEPVPTEMSSSISSGFSSDNASEIHIPVLDSLLQEDVLPYHSPRVEPS